VVWKMVKKAEDTGGPIRDAQNQLQCVY
jgi:hypothetical protein